ncbi:MAG: hypothetical protein KGD65_10105 [Candidatus Lokiarchaeota archaeon]|nr:hypothetical protein [Candidatus Lokiarchaeota archaeon]
MILHDFEITHKKTDKILVGYTNFRGEISDIPSQLEKLNQQCGDFALGLPLAVIDYGVYSSGGKDIDICIPIKETIELDNINTKYLESREVFSKIHIGSLENINQTFGQLAEYFSLHGIPSTARLRLVFHLYNKKNPSDNEIEVQSGIHPWDKILASNIETSLGGDARKEIMKDKEKYFTIESSINERAQWIKSMLEKLDETANKYEKYDILSCCAHNFSQKRISTFNSIWKKTGSVEEVLKKMHQDYDWYEDPELKENVIHVTKIPYNREVYEKAETLEEKKKSYCHCPMIRNHLNEGISPTFCNCSAGWYRQLWEGILERPVSIKIIASLVKGDQNCRFAISLPTI